MKTHENGETPDDPLFRQSEITFQEQYEASRIVPVLSRASPAPVTGVCSQPCGDGASSLDRLLGYIFGMIHFFVSPGPENVEVAIWEVELSSVCNAAVAGGAVKIWWRSEHSSRRRPLGCPPSLIPKQVP